MSVLPFEVALILLSMTRSSIWSALLSISLYSLPSRNIEQSISFRAETPFAGYFLTASVISRSRLASLASKSVDQNVLQTLFLQKEETPKTFLLHRMFSLNLFIYFILLILYFTLSITEFNCIQ